MAKPLNIIWPNNTQLTFDPDTRRLELSYNFDAPSSAAVPENVQQRISVVMCQESIDDLVRAMTEDVAAIERRRREQGVEERLRIARARKYPGFSVFHTEKLGNPLIEATEYIHRYTCTMAPPAAREATAQTVKELVALHSGNVRHQLDFCRNCFPTHEGMGPDIFSPPVTNSGELRAALDKLQAEHVRAARIARGEHGVDVELDLQDDTGIEQLMGSDLNPAERAAVDGQLDDSVTLPV